MESLNFLFYAFCIHQVNYFFPGRLTPIIPPAKQITSVITQRIANLKVREESIPKNQFQLADTLGLKG